MPSVILRDTNLQGNITEKDSITIDGIVLGDLSSDRIHLNNSAKVRGKLSHRNLVVDEGAQLEIASLTRKKITNNHKE